MRVLASRKGFSLVELLTVIAIIAILASIIFPVMAMVSNKARMNKCITQLHQIGLGLQVFKQDNRRYPDILGTTVQYTGTPATIIPWDQTQGAAAGVMGLFPEYVKSCRLYHCPNSKNTDTSAYESYDPYAYDPPRAGRITIDVYSYDSYDFMRLSPTALQQHYVRCWAGDIAAVTALLPNAPTDPAADYERQLKFRTPPDSTVVTWCSWHENPGPTGKTPTLFLGGNVDALPAGDVENYKWRVLPRKE